MNEESKLTDKSSLLKQAFLALQEAQAKLDAVERRDREPVAIVGMGCRFPGGAVDPNAFWELLRAGRDAVVPVPPDRWDIEEYYDPDPDKPGKMIAREAGFLQQRVDGFDAQFFGIAPREAANIDPQQRLALEVAWETLENSGYAPAGLHGTKTGVFLGIASRDYGQLISHEGDPEKMDGHYALGVSHSVASGRISYILGLEGPSISIDTACSSSLVAVHLACQSLRTGDSTLALAGGVNLMLSPETTVSLSRLKMLSPSGSCKTFDEDADGFARGEGCGFVALKLLSNAQADGDRILAVIRGSAVNQDGASSSLTAPNGPAQMNLMRQALANGGVPPRQVSYVEAHGTGTPLGDPIELQAVGAVYGLVRGTDAPLAIGSLKTNFGHLEAAAGIAGLMKVVLALEHRQIPAHLHLNKLTSHVQWDKLRLTVPRQLTDWKTNSESEDGPRIAAVSSFGYSGTNAHIVIAEAVQPEVERGNNGWPAQLLTVSGKTKTALQNVVGQYRNFLEENPATDLRDFCFTANAGRTHFPHRACFVASTVEHLTGQLAGFRVSSEAKPATPPRIGFLFTGQGSQYPGMGRELYESSKTFRDAMERCDQAWKRETGESLMDVLYPAKGEPDKLERAQYAQPALYAFEIAFAEMWRSWGVVPNVVLGHSLGEYAAAAVADVFSVEDGIRLVAARARLMDTLRERGTMRAVSAAPDRVREVLTAYAGEVEIAVVNGPEAVVISGMEAAVVEAAAKLEEKKIRTRALTVTHGFHSPVLQPILDEFERIAAEIEYKTPHVRMILNLTGEAAKGDEMATARYWRDQMRRTVQFDAGLQALLQTGCSALVEIGPQPHLLSLGQSAYGKSPMAWLPSARRGRNAWLDILNTIQTLYGMGIDLNWRAVHGKSGKPMALPTYPFERQPYWFARKQEPAVESRTQGKQDDPTANCFYDVAWVPIPAALKTEFDISGTCVLCGPEKTVASFAAGLNRPGVECVTVPATSESAAGADWAAKLETIQKQTTTPVGDFFYVADERGDVADFSAAALRDAEKRSVAECLAIVQGLLRADFEAMPRLWIVTRGAQGPTVTDAAHSTLWGFGRALRLEYPEMRTVCIDLDPSAEIHAATLLQCVRAAGTENEFAVRGETIYAPRLHPVEVKKEQAPQQGSTVSVLNSSPEVFRSMEPASHNGRVEMCEQNTVEPKIIRDDAAYLVTGGLSGVGLEVAKWLACRHAGQVIVMGRTPANPETRKILQSLGETGTIVAESLGDVSKEADVAAAVGQAVKFPLRGVFHCAGVLDDGALLQQNWERFERVLAPKAIGAWNLHNATKTQPLDHFVLFSSVAAIFGSPGQTNYAAANAFLDAIASERHSRGLPALSINWGAWSETGMSLRTQATGRASSAGMVGFSTSDGLRMMELAMKSGRSRLIAARIDWTAYFASVDTQPRRAFLSELEMSHAAQSQTVSPKSADTLWQLRLHAVSPAKRQDLLRQLLEERVQTVLGIPSTQEIDPAQPLQELGLDSLLSIELRNSLNRSLERNLPATLLFNYPTLRSLAQFLSTQVNGEDIGRSQECDQGRPNSGRADLLDEIEALSDEEIDRLLSARVAGGVQ